MSMTPGVSSPCIGPSRRTGREAALAGRAVTLPDPVRLRTKPSARRRSSAALTVMRLTPKVSASRRSPGRRAFSDSRPSRISSFSASDRRR